MSRGYDHLRKILASVPPGGGGAEIGVHKGGATRVLREVLQPASLMLIDPWINDPLYASRPFACKSTDEDLATARAALQFEFSEDAAVSFHPDRAESVLTEQGDQSLDWIYLDGCKYYPELSRELELALKKLRPGGVLLGAGLTWAEQLGYPVRAALADIAARLPEGVQMCQEGDYFLLRPGPDARLAPRPEKQSFLVISTMKNEAPFILEWVAHYRALGFTDFLIYTNDCDDATVPLLQRLQDRGIVRHEANRVLRRGPHKSALKYAQDHVLTAKAAWVLICDVDEFLNIRTGAATFPEYVAALGDDTDVVPFPWQVFGTGGIDVFADAPVTAQFTACQAPPRRGGERTRAVKSAFRKPERFKRFGLHRPRVADGSGLVWRAPDGTDISDRMNNGSGWMLPWKRGAGSAYMNHYPLRSIQAYIVKKHRGRANHVNEDLDRDYFDRWNLNEAHDGSIATFRPAMRAELDRLLADGETRELHAQGVAQFKARFDALMAEPRYRMLYDALRAGAAETPQEN